MTLAREQQVRNGALYVARLALTSLLPLLVLPIFTRVLTRADYGVLALVQVYAVFSSALANLGLIVAFDRNFFEYDRTGERLALLSSVVMFVGMLAVIVGAGTYVLRGTLAGWVAQAREHGDLLFCAYWAACIVSINEYYLTHLRNSENALAHVLFGVCESIVGVCASLVFVVFLRIGPMGLLLGQLTGAGVVLVAMTLFVFRAGRPRVGVAGLGACLRIGLPLTPRIFLGVVNNQFDKYMIGLLRAAGSVGFYSIGQMFAYAVFMFMTALQNVFSPQVYQRMFSLGDEGGKAVGRYLTPFAYMSVGSALLVVLFSEEVVTLLLPVSYHGSIEVAVLLACYYAVLFFGKQPQITYAKKTYIVPVLSVFSVSVNVSLNVFFITHWGAIGAAAATLLAGVCSTLVGFVVAQRCYRIDWEYASLVSMYAVLLLSMLCVLVTRFAAAPYAARLGLKSILLLSFVAMGIRRGILGKHSVELVRDSFLSGKRAGGAGVPGQVCSSKGE